MVVDFKDSLAVEAAEKREHLERLFATRRALDADIEAARGYAERMNPLLALHGLEPINLEQDNGKHGFASVGNRSETMPPRREAFESMTLKAAVKAILSGGELLHATELVERIYASPDPTQARRAKHSLVGTLAQGVRDGDWARPKPNTYQAIPAIFSGGSSANGAEPELATAARS